MSNLGEEYNLVGSITEYLKFNTNYFQSPKLCLFQVLITIPFVQNYIQCLTCTNQTERDSRTHPFLDL